MSRTRKVSEGYPPNPKKSKINKKALHRIKTDHSILSYTADDSSVTVVKKKKGIKKSGASGTTKASERSAQRRSLSLERKRIITRLKQDVKPTDSVIFWQPGFTF